MRILWLTENYPPRRGGMAQACDRIVANLRQQGVLIDVVHFGPHRSSRVIQQMNGRLINMPDGEGPGHTLNCLYNLLTSSEHKCNYSHIVAFGGQTPIIALPVFKFWFKTAAILMLRGNDFDLGIFTPGKRQILTDAFAAADFICVLSQEAQQKIIPFTEAEKTTLIHNGIDFANWSPDTVDIAAATDWRRKNVGDKRILVGLIGQFKAKKGGTFLLSNVLAANLEDEFHFLLIGDVAESMQNWLNEQESRLHLSALPFLDHFELLRYMPACDFTALPSFYDGMPNVLLESATLGIPFIAARAGGIADVIGDDENLLQLSFHPGDRHGCRKALWHAASMEESRRKTCGRMLKKRVIEDFSANKETQAYMQILNKSMKRSDIGFMKF